MYLTFECTSIKTVSNTGHYRRISLIETYWIRMQLLHFVAFNAINMLNCFSFLDLFHGFLRSINIYVYLCVFQNVQLYA